MEAKIKTPVGCETCLYMATHENCNATPDGSRQNCLYDLPANEQVKGRVYNFGHRNWVEAVGGPQQQMEELHLMQLSGERSIVIGGQGEAEVNVKQTPEECSKHLHYVAEECGYFIGRLKHDGDETSLEVCNHGQYRVIWKAGRLWRIVRQKWSPYGENGEPARLVREVVTWEA